MWRRWERGYPYILAVIAGFISYFYGSPLLYDGVTDALGEAVGVSSIIVGFLATAMAIMMSLGANPLVRKLRQAGAYRRIIGYLWSTILASIVLVIISVGARFLNNFEWFGEVYQKWLVSIWLALFTLVMVGSYRSIRRMYLILILADDSNE